MTDNFQLITSYFPDLTPRQQQQLASLEPLYREWNEKINVISRKDIDAFWTHHVLHSLAIAKIIRFLPGTKIMDVGTGGGFPGIPLAILFPEAQFLLVDSIGKKIKVVQGISDALGLQNVRAQQTRAEQINEQQDFIVSRAVTAFPAFVQWVRNLIRKPSRNTLHNGILYLKGGDFQQETAPFGDRVTLYDIPRFFTEEYFETKKIIHLKL